jgi:hypothetical protein
MNGDFINYRHEVITHPPEAGVVKLQHWVCCNPGDWPELKARICEAGEIGWYLELRHGEYLTVLNGLIAAGLNSPWDVLDSSDTLRAHRGNGLV